MTAAQAIRSLTGMLKELNAIHANMADECEEIAEEWKGVGVAGGGRDDHAAEFLKRLRPHLEGLEQFASACNQQLEQVIAQPFGPPGGDGL